MSFRDIPDSCEIALTARTARRSKRVGKAVMYKVLRTYPADVVRLPGLRHFWAVLLRLPIRKTLLFCVLCVRYLPALMPMLTARPGSNLHRLLKARPELRGIVLSSFVALNWDARTRLARLINHCRTVDEIGGVIDFPPDVIVDLVSLESIDQRYRMTLDQAYWLVREGPVVLTLWDGRERVFHLGFCLATENGKRIAYVGLIQGRKSDEKINILECYRHFTKAAAGMRPRDFMVEVFKMLCRAIGVSEIRAVSEKNHPQRQLFGDVTLGYDDIWRERGGRDTGGGFFVLSVENGRRHAEDIPADKRAMYARRYSMLDAVEAELASALRSNINYRTVQGRIQKI